MRIPNWAVELTIRVATDEGKDTVPVIKWGKANRFYSSGWTKTEPKDFDIRLMAGKNRTDQKLVLLHEIAHWIVGPNESHSSKFWDKAWELYRRYKVPIRYAFGREKNYKKGAVLAYRRNKKGGGK